MGLLGGSRRLAAAATSLLSVLAGINAIAWIGVIVGIGAFAASAFAVPANAAASPGRPAPGVPGSAVVAPAAPVGHAGRWITDATGRVLTVTGVNMVAKRAPYTPAGAGFGDADARFLAANGFTAVRVGVLWQALEPRPGVFNDRYLASIAATVRDLGSHGIVSLLDFHQDLYGQRFQGEGAPAWAVDDDGLPAAPKSGFPGNYFAMPGLKAAYDNFWANAPVRGRGLQDWYAAAVAHVAAYFRGSPRVLGYDLYNEPDPGTSIGTCAKACPGMDARLDAFYARVTAAVRRADKSSLLFDEPWSSFDIGAPSGLDSPRDRDTGFSFHDYCALDDLSTLLNVACPPADDAVFASAGTVSQRTGDALLLTEFGATNDAGVLSGVVSGAERARVGWLQWSFCGCDDPTGSPRTEGLVNNAKAPPAGDNVNTGMLDALAVPSPELVAGTPESYGYDPGSRVFTLRYRTERADGTAPFPAGSVTSVSVPAVQYPHGYAVRATGARVVKHGRVLTLASEPGATGVSVTVRPG